MSLADTNVVSMFLRRDAEERYPKLHGLDSGAGSGWDLAARLWADAGAQKPSVVFSDADLLIAATAAANEREFVTCEVALAQGLERMR